VQVHRFEDVDAWRRKVEGFLLADEARHNLVFGIADTLTRHPLVYPDRSLWAVENHGGVVVGAALRTPPHNLVLARPRGDAVVEALADRLTVDDRALPGVNAADPEASAFADAWRTRTGSESRRAERLGVYALRTVRPTPVVAGSARRASERDLSTVLRWIEAFEDEVVPPEMRSTIDQRRRRLEASLRSDGHDEGILFWELEGEPVSLAGFGSPTPNGIRIGPVYTPPQLRGHGYATAIVAEASRRALAGGRTFCFLYTQLANPTSNAIYRRIGYEQVCEAVVIAFDDA
jgi:hypothetical protein